MKVIDITKNQWTNVIHFTTDHNKGSMGFRLPAIFLYNNKLRISQDVSGKVMHDTDVDFETNKWIILVISSLKKGSSTWYTVTVNGKVIETMIDTAPRSYSNVKLYVSDPWYSEANVVIQDFSISVASKYKMVPYAGTIILKLI